ncbi:hypothetical protein AUV08_04550 [Micrococcus sp. CH7]|nr:hypothetical protein AUV08_04550 [Micrococcus sp. CH7]
MVPIPWPLTAESVGIGLSGGLVRGSGPVSEWMLIAPVLVFCLWLAHAVDSWRRPYGIGKIGWVLLIGTPIASLVVFLATALVHDPTPSANEALPRGEIHDLQVRLMVVSLELFLAWVVCLILEIFLYVVRSVRRKES